MLNRIRILKLSKEDFNKQIFIRNIPLLKEEVIEENKYKMIGEVIASGIYSHVERGLES